MNNDFKCQEHQRLFENICFQCNHLLCSRCLTAHNKDKNHYKYCEHIDDIKLTLENHMLSECFKLQTTTITNPFKRQKLDHKSDNNDNHSDLDTPEQDNDNDIDKDSNIDKDRINNDNESLDPNSKSFISERIADIWKTIKSSSEQYKKLTITQSDISKHFNEYHRFLIDEEKALTREIVNDKELIVNQIEHSINELKYYTNIFYLNNQLINLHNDNINNNNNNENHIYSTETTLDTADSYSTKALIESINTNESLISFIQSNNDTVFNQQNISYINIKDVFKQYSDVDSMILDSIYKLNSQLILTTPKSMNIN
ncbi:hypothetical protein PPL_12104 [Heterostelium album PN500]|uniref:B box-type domain-containing protein n=1 Tax=Heterostelium pallidum (strain ATCC 26659 / Pp 5 / PN500) TaxID=670386 RepID=D3BLQ1_HETP5|nr:hypothetical protein PPL_12104 [Heterostelium album PN500]EFA77502.1 hypothetical protein PPL_12104 [Heterostelium album PN500]|eukprot:XP_020429630.1 hypothetical protein PPL_12104 [Heterostelium album PN500]